MPVEQSINNILPVLNSLSVCIIVKNEADLLGRCLDSIKGAADELVVVDTGSTDSTVDIARNRGAKVICTQWQDDFAWARNLSIEHATGSWILWLDADDIVPAASIPLLNKLKFQKPDRILGFTVRNERPGNTGTEFIQARMFPNRKDIYFERRIHEQIMPSALRIGMKMESFHQVVIEHHGYADPATMKKKALRNIKLLIADYNETDPDSVTLVEIADSYQLTEDYENAKKWYEKTLAIHNCESATPSIAGQAHLGLGNIYNLQGTYDRAIMHLKKASQISPWRPDILYSLAVGMEQNNQSDEAIKSLFAILSMEPKAGQVGVDFRASRIKSNLRLLRLLVEQNRITEAAKVVADALQAQPDRPELHNAAGKFFLKCDQLIEALHAFEKSILLVKDGNIDAYIGLCIIYLRAGAQQKATDTIEALSMVFTENQKLSAFRAYIEKKEITEPQRIILSQLRREFFNVF